MYRLVTAAVVIGLSLALAGCDVEVPEESLEPRGVEEGAGLPEDPEARETEDTRLPGEEAFRERDPAGLGPDDEAEDEEDPLGRPPY